MDMSKIGITRSFRVGELAVEAYESTEAMGKAAAEEAAERMRSLAAQNETVAVVFATGASQMATLDALIAMPDLPWNKVVAFHMDEYLGLSDQHPASFRRYMREHLTSKVKMRQFYGVDGTAADTEKTIREYAELLRQHNPQLCLLGIGENGHLAFNDPAEADFEDPLDIKIVSLDEQCRQQQVSEGWFKSVPEVPKQAITLTIPTLFRVPQLILSVPGERKAHIVHRTLTEEISTKCPATILRKHPHATVYLDPDSATELPS
jgi:glucosamine-6-phosphate deaminase